jgi:predicted membrane GTPase involved in stress response
VILVVNKVDRPDARIAEVVDEVYELFLDLDADEHQIEFPIVYCERAAGRASLDPPEDGGPDSSDLEPLFETDPRDDPGAASTTRAHPLQAHVTNLDASPYLGRLALCRVATARSARAAGRLVPHDGTIERSRSPSCYVTEALDRVPPTRPARATSSRSPASPRSRSARRSPTRRPASRCR